MDTEGCPAYGPHWPVRVTRVVFPALTVAFVLQQRAPLLPRRPSTVYVPGDSDRDALVVPT